LILSFSRQLALKNIAPEKNREKFDILQSHNMLSVRQLQKDTEASIYKHAETGKASAVATAMADRERGNVFEEFDHGWHGFQGCPERLWKTWETANYP